MVGDGLWRVGHELSSSTGTGIGGRAEAPNGANQTDGMAYGGTSRYIRLIFFSLLA